MTYLYHDESDVFLSLHVQPAAKTTAWAGLYGERVKVRLAAPPTEGRANDALCLWLAAYFDLAIRDVRVVRGDKSRQKTICFNGEVERYASISAQLNLALSP